MSKILKIAPVLNDKDFPIKFSALYALAAVFIYYPGIIEEDSVNRWNLARHIAYHGFSGLESFDNHHPVVPSILQAPFYWLTGEIGFFAVLQAFSFSYLLFLFVKSCFKGWQSNLITTICLLFPINYMISISHTFDTLFAIAFLLFLILLPTWHTSKLHLLKLPILFFLMVSLRLNGVALLLPVVVYIFVSAKRNSIQVKKVFVISFCFFLSAIAPFIITKSLNFTDKNSWAIGFAWVYGNLATKSENSYHRMYLDSIGINPASPGDNVCYHGIFCGSGQLLWHKAAADREVAQEVLKNYIKIAWEEPSLFIRERAKYISSLMGMTRPLGRAYVDMYRFDIHQQGLQSYGFFTTENKEKITDIFIATHRVFAIMHTPWVILLLSMLILFFLYSRGDRQLFSRISVATVLGWSYYFTFMITAQQHNIRYFFPTLLVFQGCLIAALALPVHAGYPRSILPKLKALRYRLNRVGMTRPGHGADRRL